MTRLRLTPLLLAALAGGAPLVLPAQRIVTLTVTVVDARTGRVLEGVAITVNGHAAGVTDSGGRVRLERLRLRGADEFGFRRIGYEPLVGDLSMPAGDTSGAVSVRLTPTAVDVPGMVVAADAIALGPWVEAFERRRLQGKGKFLTWRDIDRRVSSLSATDLLRWAGVTVLGEALTNNRRLRVPGAQCSPPLVFLDGTLLAGQAALMSLDILPPEHIGAIEVYKSASEMPAEFNVTDSACGVIVIWTRRK